MTLHYINFSNFTLCVGGNQRGSEKDNGINYRESTNIGHTIYFTKRTGHLKMRFSRIFPLSEHNKHTKLHSQCGKNSRNSIFKYPVRFVK